MFTGINESSPFARELRGRFPFLKFSPEIEREFIASYRRLILPRVRIALVTAFILIITFDVMDRLLHPLHMVSLTSLVRFGIIFPVLLLGGLVSFIKALRAYIMPAIVVSVLVAGLGTIYIFLINYHFAFHVRYESLILTTAVVYFLTGLLFKTTIICCGTVMAAYLAGCVVTGVDSPLIISSGIFLFLMNIVGAGGCYLIERATRANYLQRRILQDLAERDGLTGIFNRHTFDVSYPRLWRQAARDGKIVAVMMVDVDHFKPFNDTYGHLEGDVCLKRIAEVLAGFVRRPLDMVARYGGEEFIAVWYDTDADRARELSEQCRAGVESLGISHATSGVSEFVTVSAGTAIAVPRRQDRPEDLLRAADTALYEAKGRGRNRAVIAASPQQQRPESL
ncbi:MAG: diguanylate cyclase [Spirochaetes bacterium]|nr:diguanylate cyclase [Spirochaetota bacterium]